MYNMGLQTPQGNILSSWSIVSYKYEDMIEWKPLTYEKRLL